MTRETTHDLRYLQTYVLPAAFSLLPEEMRSAKAEAQLLAIGLQESGFQHRHQVGGPAHGFWQFERGGGVTGVLTHPRSGPHLRRVCQELCYQPTVTGLYTAIEHHDVLACCFARLLLWTLPQPLAGRDESALAWHGYLAAWRPGKPHRETWDAYYARAWDLVAPQPWTGAPAKEAPQ
jgi:hypothetical protein